MLHWSLCETVSLGGEPTGKKWIIRNKEGYGGWGQGQDLLLCNLREAQTLNVNWQSRGAVVYQATVTRLCSAHQLCNPTSQGREDFIFPEPHHFLSNSMSQQRKKLY